MSIFSNDEIDRRWERVRRNLGDIECAIVPSFSNSYYLSGVPVIRYGRWAITVFFRDAGPVLVVPEFEGTAAVRFSPIADVRTYRDDDGPTREVPLALVVDAIRAQSCQVVGIEGEGMPTDMYLRLQKALPTATIVDITDVIDDVRIVGEEIAYMREAARIADVGMAAVLEHLAPGMTEADLTGEAIVSMQREGTPDAVVTNCVCYMQQGDRSIEGHGRSMKVPVEGGGLLEIVCEAEVWHYMAGVERAVIIGDVPEEVDQAYRTALKAFHAARAAIRPGISFGDVHRVARTVFAEAGYGDRVIMGSGLVRSILTNHGGRIENANFRGYNQRLLEPGMVVSIEPWAAVPGVGGQRYCDMVLVTEDGHEVLSQTTDELLQVDWPSVAEVQRA